MRGLCERAKIVGGNLDARSKLVPLRNCSWLFLLPLLTGHLPLRPLEEIAATEVMRTVLKPIRILAVDEHAILGRVTQVCQRLLALLQTASPPEFQTRITTARLDRRANMR